MPEDAGKKRYINEFLQTVARGSGFIEDIRIERAIRQPGSDGEGSTARSLSGRKINNITELLEDDLKHTFDEGFFAFRFVAALVGSGKTSLLTYLNELAKTKSTYFNHSIVFQFRLSDITPLGDNFGIKFYCHILADTFWQLLNNQNLSNSVKLASENILSEFLDDTEFAQLTTSNKGTRIKQVTIDNLIKKREQIVLDNLDKMVEVLNLTPNVKQKLQNKLDNNEICF